jgi:DNA replication protein DnaC
LALAKLLYINNITVKAYNIIEFLDEIKSSFDSNDFLIKDFLKVKHALILDDFGTEKVTDWTQEIIYRLINLRYEKMLQTFFISNLSPSKIGDVYGDRIMSRITEMVGGKDSIIKMTGQDRRI